MSQTMPLVYYLGRRRNPKLEAKWREVLAGWRASGRPVQSYCRMRGLSQARFYFWRKELARREGGRPRGGGAGRGISGVSDFVELHPVPTPTRPAGMDGYPVELLLPEGARLLIRRDCDGELLGVVLEALREGREGRSC